MWGAGHLNPGQRGLGAGISRSTLTGPRARCTQETRAPHHSHILILLLRSPSTTSRAFKYRELCTDGAKVCKVGAHTAPAGANDGPMIAALQYDIACLQVTTYGRMP